MAIHLTPEVNPTVQEGTLYVDSATGEFNVAGRTTPHIIPGVLYPAVSGKLLDGTTTHGTGTYDGVSVSTNYGTTQSDGRKYYYTDIKGSKPIKDPRVGGHFGSQRHKAKSIQLLEQETATHGQNVYSIDGREWMRITGPDIRSYYNDNTTGNVGTGSAGTTGTFLEIVGYFSDANYLQDTHTAERNIITSVDGGSTNTNSSFVTSVGSPLSGRYVDESSVGNLNLPSTHSTTLGIHTLKINWPTSNYPYFFGIELIAQDTTSTANRSKIQIPSQNVVSYGKKFTVSAEGSSGHHYDPFNGFTSGSSVSSYVDTATSLGLDKWLHSSNYYRPYNGGRVIKWVDSSGVIKTSVTLMPPNAKSIADSSSLTNATAKANASASNDTFYPTFEAHTTDVNEDQLHEVAKTFHWREFGNGSANGGTGSSYLDASMLDTNERNIAYVMDDGLTSVAGDQVFKSGAYGLLRWDTGSKIYFTFIGTGLTWNTSTLGIKHWAQNLPYGTHIVELETSSTSSEGTFKIDGVTVKSDFANSGDLHIYKWHPSDDITFHQPKRPPIPEDAVVLCDYMLMADFVADTVGDTEKISKGTRLVSPSRDFFYDEDANTSFNNITIDPNSALGLTLPDTGTITSGSISAQLPYFGKEVIWRTLASRFGTFTEYVNNTSVTTTSISTNSNYNAKQKITGQSLGLNGIKTVKSSDRFLFAGLEVATPIHTSSHYQAFETRFLHELVGGDRNMEQHNLVCSPDGKTWDEVTRDTNYIGDIVLNASTDTETGWSSVVVLDEWRGKQSSAAQNFYNKYFAIGYDRLICLKDGEYALRGQARSNASGAILAWEINNETAPYGYTAGSDEAIGYTVQKLKRGDVVKLKGEFGFDALNYSQANIIKLN